MPAESKGRTMMRQSKPLILGLALIAVCGSLGCQKKAEQAATPASSDSLVASNPTERSSGNLTPQTSYQEPQQQPQTPAPAPAPQAVRPKPHSPAPSHTPAPHHPSAAPPPMAVENPGVTMAAGTSLKVEVTAAVTTETAQPGDAWSGTVKDNVIVGDRVVVPAGAVVNGVVRAATPAKKGDRAMLLLGVTSVNVDGRDIAVSGSTDSIIAGSTRARNMGAVAGGAAAGALLGRAIGGSGKGGLIGGLIGAAGTAAVVANTKGYQVAIKPGTEITFTTDHAVTVHR
jgi:hypothetical protein